MCDPITIGGLALSTLGGVAQGRTQQAYVDEVNRQNKRAYDMSQRAREAERARQREMETQAADAWSRTTDDLTRENFDATKDAAAATFVDTLDALPRALTTDARLPGQDGASVEVKDAINTRVNSEAAKTRDRIRAFASLQGYGSAGMDRGLAMGETGDFLSVLGGLRRGSLAVAQQEQDIVPATVRPGSTALGDILSGVGSLMLMGGPGTFKAKPRIVRPKPNPFY